MFLSLTGRFLGPYLRGSSSPMSPISQARKSPPLLTFLSLDFSLFLHDSCLQLEGKERGDLDLPFHQSISPLSEGKLLDLDLGVHLLSSSLFFLSSSPISISCFWWDLRVKDLSTCALAIVLCIGLCSPRGFVEVESL